MIRARGSQQGEGTSDLDIRIARFTRMTETELQAAKTGGIGHWVDYVPGVVQVAGPDTRSTRAGLEELLEIGKHVLYSAEVLVGVPDRD